jgi:hypothetical protein
LLALRRKSAKCLIFRSFRLKADQQRKHAHDATQLQMDAKQGRLQGLSLRCETAAHPGARSVDGSVVRRRLAQASPPETASHSAAHSAATFQRTQTPDHLASERAPINRCVGRWICLTEIGSASGAVPKVIAKEAAKKILLRSIKYLVLTFSFVRRNIPPQERAPYQPQNDDSYRMTFQTVFLDVYQVRYK